MRVEKGSYGYRNYHILRNAGLTALIALFIAAQIAYGRRVGGTLSIVLTLTGILCVLPMANILSPLLAMMRFRTPDRPFFEKTEPYSGRGILLYDLIFTTKEKAFPADAVMIRSGAVLVCGPAGQEAEGPSGKQPPSGTPEATCEPVPRRGAVSESSGGPSRGGRLR